MSSQALKIASFFGWSNSGKTGLLAGLVEAYRHRGLACGAVKSSRHPGDFGDEGKDTGRFRAAGASPVLYFGAGEARTSVLFMQSPSSPDRAWLEGLFAGVDRLLVEGLEVEGALRILVEAGDRIDKRGASEVDFLVSDDERRRLAFESEGKKAFPHEAIEAILDALEEAWKGK
ncbi:MAG TPA: molybdopterin-guanine dinucleotide biosynthesis protein MobB [Rectinemataceae bacterium]|nr:molybdopterin-guanine dinucleotide biosynthesis protein MobB [Rectinemataceae bacterium]